jgi:hypothetical protein
VVSYFNLSRATPIDFVVRLYRDRRQERNSDEDK